MKIFTLVYLINEPFSPALTLAKQTSSKIAGFSRPFNYLLNSIKKILTTEDIISYWKRMHVYTFSSQKSGALDQALVRIKASKKLVTSLIMYIG